MSTVNCSLHVYRLQVEDGRSNPQYSKHDIFYRT